MDYSYCSFKGIDVRLNCEKIAYFSSYMKFRGVMKHPRGVYGTPFKKYFKYPLEALFVLVLRAPTKELSELPILTVLGLLFVYCCTD